MQANHWADLLTTTPRNQAMHYEPSSPRAPPLLSQSPRAHTASASVHTGSSGDAQQTRVPTHSDHTRVHTTRSDSTRSGYTSSDQMRGATSRPTSVAPATHKVANRQRPTDPGVDQGPHLVQHTPPTRHQATSVEGPCKGAPRGSRPAMGEVTLGEPERADFFSPAAPCNCPAQRQDVTYLLRE